MSSYTLMVLRRKKDEIDQLAHNVAFFYLLSSDARRAFIFEENKISNGYLTDFANGRINFSQAISGLQLQFQNINKIHFQLQMGKIKLYAIAQQERQRHSIWTITLKRVGFVGGALQAIGGWSICESSLGVACKSFGVPLMMHGAENFWENGYYLVYHEDPKKVPVRYAYRYIANMFGGNDNTGDIAYSTGDIALSIGSASTLTLKPDAWRLFRYIREDYIRNWMTLGVVGGASEIVGNAASGFSVYQLSTKGTSSVKE